MIDGHVRPHGEENDTHLRVLAAGGCHVEGFPFGIDQGFFMQALNSLGRPYVYQYVRQSRLSSPRRVLRQCEAFKPQILVLQLGHYESLLYLHKRYARLLKRRNGGSSSEASGSSESSESSSEEASTSFSTSEINSMAGRRLSRWSILSWPVLWALDRYLTISGFPHVKLSVAIEQASSYFQAIQQIEIPHVFVVEPFPHADFPLALSRRKLSAVMRKIATEHGFRFVETAKPLKQWSKTNRQGRSWRETLFLDSAHLSAQSHVKVGELLAVAIDEALQSNSDLQEIGHLAS